MKRQRNDLGERLRKRGIEAPEPPRERLRLGLVVRTVALVALGAWAVQGLLGSSHGLRRILGLRRENAALAEEQRRLAIERDSVTKLARLQRTPQYVEKLAREQLGLARKDEIVYRLQPMDGSGGPPEAQASAQADASPPATDAQRESSTAAKPGRRGGTAARR